MTINITINGATLTPDEVEILRWCEVSCWVSYESDNRRIYEKLAHEGYIAQRYTPDDHNGKTYYATAVGREHLAALASTPVDVATDVTMLVRKSSGGKTLGDPAFYIYPFLPGDASESAIEEGTFISAYPRAIEGASFGMDYNEIAMNAAQVRKLIAALEYALSTITE